MITYVLIGKQGPVEMVDCLARIICTRKPGRVDRRVAATSLVRAQVIADSALDVFDMA